MKIEILKDYALKNVIASNGTNRLWCRFSPYDNTVIYKIESLKTKKIIVMFANLKSAVKAYNNIRIKDSVHAIRSNGLNQKV